MEIGKTFQMIKARQILTSRGDPTVEVDLHTSIGVFRSSCPSGASTGSKEAKAIVDKNDECYLGKSVKKAIFHINNLISPRIDDISHLLLTNQTEIDKFLIHLDGTPNKSRIGANAILPLSQSFCKAGAASEDLSLREYISNLSHSEKRMPIPYFNVINGGVHSGNNLPFQEIMISFHEKDFDKNLEKAVVFYNFLKKEIISKFGAIATGIGDEGGFAPPVETLDEALDLIMKAFKESKLTNMKIAIDSAASEFYKDGMYNLQFKKRYGNRNLDGKQLAEYYEEIIGKYPLVHMLEDPFAENDFQSWQDFQSKMESKGINIVGDDLTVTNKKHIQYAIDNKLCNTLLVKLNQIGTITETLESIRLARSAGMKIMVSHRSGETEDTFIADFSAGIGADYIKAGAPCRGERIAKYNQLLRIFESVKKSKNHNKEKS